MHLHKHFCNVRTLSADSQVIIFHPWAFLIKLNCSESSLYGDSSPPDYNLRTAGLYNPVSDGELPQHGVSGGAWQECKNQMTSNGNSRACWRQASRAISFALINTRDLAVLLSLSFVLFLFCLAQLVSTWLSIASTTPQMLEQCLVFKALGPASVK